MLSDIFDPIKPPKLLATNIPYTIGFSNIVWDAKTWS